MARLRGGGASFQIAAQQTAEAVKRALVETAKREHAKVMGADPRPGGFDRWVDGQKDAREEAAKPFGVIEYKYSRLDVVTQFAMETLFDRSPVDSGDYRMSHTLFVNDEAVPNLEGWKAGKRIFISSFLPYSRMIENGKMKMRVPGTDAVYAQAQIIVQRRYGNLAKVEFTYIGVIDGGTGRARHYNKPDARFPALRIKEAW